MAGARPSAITEPDQSEMDARWREPGGTPGTRETPGLPERGHGRRPSITTRAGTLLRSLITLYRSHTSKLGNITRHEKKSNSLVVMGRGHDTRRHELDRRR